MTRSVAIVALCALSLCASSLLPATAQARAPSGRRAPSARVRPEVLREARRLSASIQASVSALRNLPVKRKLKVGVYNKRQLTDFVRAQLRSGGNERRLADQSRSWRALGLLPAGYDLFAGLSALLDEQVAGLYDPASQQLRIMARLVPVGPRIASPLELLTGSPEDQARFVLSHEIVHALQDQHHDLRRMARDRPGENDLEIALSGLFEGDATAAGLAWMMAERGAYDELGFFASAGMMGWMMKLALRLARLGILPDTASLRRTPRALQERLLFPYSAGLQFAMKVGQQGGFAAIDALYRRPPLSSEQILHPHKLIGSLVDHPIVLALPDVSGLLGRPYRQGYADTLGELMIRVLLEDLGPDVVPKHAAAGWGGDRHVLYTATGQPDVLVWLSTWDTKVDAVQFERALSALVAAKRGPPGHVTRKGQDVLLLVGVAEAARARVARRVFAGTRRLPRTRLPR